MKDTLLPVALIGGIAWYIWSRKQAAGNLNFALYNVGAEMRDGAPVIILYVAVQNPSNQSFTVNAVVGTLKLNGQYIGNVTGFDRIPIAAASESVYPIYVRINLIGGALTLYNLISQGIGSSQSIAFDGSINASGIVSPIKINASVG